MKTNQLEEAKSKFNLDNIFSHRTYSLASTINFFYHCHEYSGAVSLRVYLY
jgi:hypothetical protein